MTPSVPHQAVVKKQDLQTVPAAVIYAYCHFQASDTAMLQIFGFAVFA